MSRKNSGEQCSIKSSFFMNEFNNLDEFYNNIDHRINTKLAQTMKKAILLIIDEVDLHLSNKMESLIENEVNKKIQFILYTMDIRNNDPVEQKSLDKSTN